MHLSHIVKRTYGDVTIGTALTENRLESSVLYLFVKKTNQCSNITVFGLQLVITLWKSVDLQSILYYLSYNISKQKMRKKQ